MIDHAIPFFNIFAIICVLLPLPWHWRARNSGTLLLIGWLFVANLNQLINGLTWWSGVDNKAPVWCDISVKITTMMNMAIPCANLCIAKRLESIASTRAVASSDKDRRRRLLFDLGVGIGIPIIYGVISIVNQGHRFDIYEGIGCYPPTYYSWAYIVFGITPPIIVSLISLVYSCLALRWFVIRRQQFHAVLQSSGSNLDKSRYLRMIALTSVDLLVALPVSLTVYGIQIAKTNGILEPYTSWESVHEGFGAVVQVPKEAWEVVPDLQGLFGLVDAARWVTPVAAFIFFMFFGFSKEAVQEYKSWYQTGLRRLRFGGRPSNQSAPAKHISHIQVNTLPHSGSSYDGDLEKDIELGSPKSSFPPTPSAIKHSFTDYQPSSPTFDSAVTYHHKSPSPTQGVSVTVERLVSQ